MAQLTMALLTMVTHHGAHVLLMMTPAGISCGICFVDPSLADAISGSGLSLNLAASWGMP
jgi:hypothetical protein